MSFAGRNVRHREFKKKNTGRIKVAVESAVLCMEMTAGDLTSLLPVGAVDGICKA